MVDEYMEHYNYTRKQWDLKKMTPAIPKSSNRSIDTNVAFY